MDPLSKRRVWQMIEDLKTDRILLLTTHSMEEADALGDSVAILHQARLRAAGTSLFLKATYGKGHTVSIQSDEANDEQIETIVKSTMPSAEMVATAAGNHTISLPKSAVGSIPRLLGRLMTEAGLVKEVSAQQLFFRKAFRCVSAVLTAVLSFADEAAAIVQWGISNTTLEEVFLKLASHHTEVNAQTQDQTLADVRSRVMLVRRQPGESEDRVTPPAGSDDILCILESGSSADEFIVMSGDVDVIPVPEIVEEPAADHTQMEAFTMPLAGAAAAAPANGMQMAAPTQQIIELEVPSGAAPGQTIQINVGGQYLPVMIPIGAAVGQRIQMSVPLPQQEAPQAPQALPFSNGLDPTGTRQVVTATLFEQVLGIVWKDLSLSLGCRCGKGRGCCSFKCCELFCYLFLFVVFASIVLIQIAFNNLKHTMTGAPSVDYCANGVRNTSYNPTTGQGCGSTMTGAHTYSYNNNYGDQSCQGQPGCVPTCDTAGVASSLEGLHAHWRESCQTYDPGGGAVAYKTCPFASLTTPLGATITTDCWADLLGGPWGQTARGTECAEAGQIPKSDRLMCSLPITMWYADAPGAPTLAELLGPDGLHQDASPTAWMQQHEQLQSSGTTSDHLTVPFQFMQVDSVNQKAMQVQAALRDAALLDNSKGLQKEEGCSEDGSLLLSTHEDALIYSLQNFAAFGIEVQAASPLSGSGAVSLQYGIKTWCKPDRGNQPYRKRPAYSRVLPHTIDVLPLAVY